MISCDGCNVVVINGTVCHEEDCPNSDNDSLRGCIECGQQFITKSLGQIVCDKECYRAYFGHDTMEDI
jgi:hypothetical protein